MLKFLYKPKPLNLSLLQINQRSNYRPSVLVFFFLRPLIDAEILVDISVKVQDCGKTFGSLEQHK